MRSGVSVVIRLVSWLILAAVLLAVWLVVTGLGATPRPADVAIVFGNTVERTGKPSARLRARLVAARDLYASKLVRKIIVTGGLGREGFDESDVMRDWLVRAGVPAADIHEDSEGLNTAQSCANAHAYMTAQGLSTADVVTQYFHVARACLACRRAGIRVVGATSPRFFEQRDLHSIAREVVGFPVYLLGIK